MRRFVVSLFALPLALGCASTEPATRPAAPPPAVPQAANAGTAAAQAATPSLPPLPPLPDTPRVLVTDTYFGTKVEDPYRWLENWNDPKVQAWSDAQNVHARAALARLPGLDLLRERIGDLMTRRPSSLGGFAWRKGTFFALRFDPANKQQPSLVVRDSITGEGHERVLLDLMALDPSGHTSMDWFVPSPDAKYVAVSLAQGGSEDGTVHVFDVATGKETGDVIPRVNEGTGAGSLAWNATSTGFWYTRYPREGERPKADLDFWQQAYFHTLGTKDSADTYAFGKDLPRIAEIGLESSEDGTHQLAMVQKGDGGEFKLFVRSGKRWIQVADYPDRIVQATFGRDQAIWLLSLKDAPKGKLLRLPYPATRLSAAKVIVPEQKGTLQQFAPMKSHLYVSFMEGGPSTLSVYDLKGKAVSTVPTPPVSSIDALGRLAGDTAFVGVASYTQPFTGYLYDPATQQLTETVVKQVALTQTDDLEVRRVMVPSKDGTPIPLNILAKKGTKLDGHNPTLLTGYGGFDLPMTPGFSDLRRVWLEQGGVWAQANLRGGNEFGEAWHQAGMLTKKQNVFDDFLACAQYLVDQRYTEPARFAIQGGSNGGLLMGAAFTQKPALFRAVVSTVGIYDMLRNELTPNGQFNTTEYGSVKDEAQFKAMLAYSPYQHVEKGTAYPAILFMTGANDPRVDPMHSRKMTATLQWATSSGRPVLLRTTGNAGHGFGTALKEVIDQQVDANAFLFDQLGVSVKPVWRK